jgi:hypothetical protein
MFVSPANKFGCDGSAVIFGGSFISIKNNKGPSIEPWGTIRFIPKK